MDTIRVIEHEGARVAAVAACVPPFAADNAERAARACGAEKAASIVAATGFPSLRLAAHGTTTFDLMRAASKEAIALSGIEAADFGAVVAVSVTPGFEMPALSNRLQASLGTGRGTVALDVRAACSGYVAGLHLAAVYAKATGKPVLLADGDVQSHVCDPLDAATAPVLSDAATATVVAPEPAGAEPWRFAFMSDGAQAGALALPAGGKIKMDGFGVFRFVTVEAYSFIRDFMEATGTAAGAVDAFVPHQANLYMVSRLAKTLGFPPESVWTCGGEYGNPGSASVPFALARRLAPGRKSPLRLLLAGFGGGLSAAAALVGISPAVKTRVFDYEGGGEGGAP